MPKMIQVRDVATRLRELVRRAKARGESLTQYIQGILEREVARPPAEDVFAQIHARKRVLLDRPVAEIVREERKKRGAA